MQAALTIEAIRIHNEVLQVLNQDMEISGSACPANDDKLINIHSEEEHWTLFWSGIHTGGAMELINMI